MILVPVVYPSLFGRMVLCLCGIADHHYWHGNGSGFVLLWTLGVFYRRISWEERLMDRILPFMKSTFLRVTESSPSTRGGRGCTFSSSTFLATEPIKPHSTKSRQVQLSLLLDISHCVFNKFNQFYFFFQSTARFLPGISTTILTQPIYN